MTALWVVQTRTKNAGIVDVGWTGLVGGLALLDAALGPGWFWRRMAVASMMGSWGARLTIHLLFDRVVGKPEEGRYADLRRRKSTSSHGADAWFFWFFQAQAAAAV